MKQFSFLISPILLFISFIFPKSKRIWVYGAWFGKRYSDNSKDLFEYANSISEHDIKHYWIYKDLSIKKEIEAKGYKAVYAYSRNGIFIQLRAKVFITCINSSDFIPFLVTPRNYFVQLGHGSPIKHIGIDSRKTKIKKLIDKFRFKTIDNYDLIISPSPVFDKVYMKAFFSKQDRLFRSGYPRNEKLFINNQTKIDIRNYFDIKEEEKIVIYLPTHRKEGKSQSPFIKILREIILKNDFLKANNIKLIVKPHFYEKNSLDLVQEASNVLIRYDIPFDLYEFLGATDILVTDYSSVMFDYELLNKKIIVFPFDFKDYKENDRGMYFKFDFIYNNVLNLEKVESIESLCESLTSAKFKPTKESMSKSVFNKPKGLYSKKIYSKILKELQVE